MELFGSFSISNIMSKKINFDELAEVIRNVEGLESDQRSALLELLKKKKKYGIVWEDSKEDAYEVMREFVPVLTEVKDNAIENGSDNPNHVLIEGDNIQALTVEKPTHVDPVRQFSFDPRKFLFLDPFKCPG